MINPPLAPTSAKTFKIVDANRLDKALRPYFQEEIRIFALKDSIAQAVSCHTSLGMLPLEVTFKLPPRPQIFKNFQDFLSYNPDWEKALQADIQKTKVAFRTDLKAEANKFSLRSNLDKKLNILLTNNQIKVKKQQEFMQTQIKSWEKLLSEKIQSLKHKTPNLEKDPDFEIILKKIQKKIADLKQQAQKVTPIKKTEIEHFKLGLKATLKTDPSDYFEELENALERSDQLELEFIKFDNTLDSEFINLDTLAARPTEKEQSININRKTIKSEKHATQTQEANEKPKVEETKDVREVKANENQTTNKEPSKFQITEEEREANFYQEYNKHDEDPEPARTAYQEQYIRREVKFISEMDKRLKMTPASNPESLPTLNKVQLLASRGKNYTDQLNKAKNEQERSAIRGDILYNVIIPFDKGLEELESSGMKLPKIEKEKLDGQAIKAETLTIEERAQLMHKEREKVTASGQNVTAQAAAPVQDPKFIPSGAHSTKTTPISVQTSTSTQINPSEPTPSTTSPKQSPPRYRSR